MSQTPIPDQQASVAVDHLHSAKMAYVKAQEDYYATPEGIAYNQERSVTMFYSKEVRDEAYSRAMEGIATRKQQKEALALNEEMESRAELQERVVPGRKNNNALAITNFDGRTASDVINEAKTSNDRNMLHQLALNNGFVDSYGTELQSHQPYSVVKNRILGNPSTAGATLRTILTQRDKAGTHTREGLRDVAKHPNANTELIEVAYDRARKMEGPFESSVAVEASKNPNSGGKLLTRIAKDWGGSSNEISNILLANPSLPEASRAELMNRRKATIVS